VVALATFFIVLVFSLVVVRIAGVALTLTGMSSESARFQARSAWTGTGFTTTESEQIVNHPVRRKIVSWLMLIRGVGVVTVVATLVLSFAAEANTEQRFMRLALLLIGLLVTWIIFSNAWVDRQLSKLILRLLGHYTTLEVRDYGELLHLSGEYIVSEMVVREGDWMADKPLAELRLPDEGVLILGVQCKDKSFIGAPRGETCISPGDTVILYGRGSLIAQLDRRPADVGGQIAHEKAASEAASEIRADKEPAPTPDARSKR
jgi:hypothetical protein